jgi:hypothetical protein
VIGAYYKMAMLSDEAKAMHKIKSMNRLDCVSFTDLINYKGLTNFVNKKGQLYLYMTSCRKFISANSKRVAEWSLTGNGLNFTSIYIDNLDCPGIGYGYPNSHTNLANGQPNPLYHFRNDAYLFLINADYTEIEIFIIPDGRHLIGSYYQIMIDEGFADEVKNLREKSKPFFNYEGIRL